MSLHLTMAGITAPVAEGGPLEPLNGRHGVGGTSTVDDSGEPRFALSIVHENGTLLTALLDEEAASRLADMVTTFIAALPARPRH